MQVITKLSNMPDSGFSVEMERLKKFFGAEAAKVILQHVTDLEGSFGSASEVIRLVIRGEATCQLLHS